MSEVGKKRGICYDRDVYGSYDAGTTMTCKDGSGVEGKVRARSDGCRDRYQPIGRQFQGFLYSARKD
jgi:hypothetical protein